MQILARFIGRLSHSRWLDIHRKEYMLAEMRLNTLKRESRVGLLCSP
jgi:hypothetical protein